MSVVDTALTRRVTDRDFLLGSVWEGTGDELHTNRLTAATSPFGGRILSGISGMVLTTDTHDPDLLWSSPSSVEWHFDAPLFEGSDLAVTGRPDGPERAIAGAVSGSTATRGSIGLGVGSPGPVVEGRATRGRTMTSADVDLFRDWMPPRSAAPEPVVPWPLLVLTASGLVNRTDYLGHPHPDMVLNRWFRWSFGELPAVEDTLHCVIGTVHKRPSASRPGLTVARFRASVVATAGARVVADADWVVIVG